MLCCRRLKKRTVAHLSTDISSPRTALRPPLQLPWCDRAITLIAEEQTLQGGNPLVQIILQEEGGLEAARERALEGGETLASSKLNDRIPCSQRWSSKVSKGTWAPPKATGHGCRS